MKEEIKKEKHKERKKERTKRIWLKHKLSCPFFKENLVLRTSLSSVVG